MNKQQCEIELIREIVARRRVEINELGQLVPGVSSLIDPESQPEWFDPEVFRHAQLLFSKYDTIIRVTELLGLNLIFYHHDGLIPLLSTGNSQTISKLFTRYLSTLNHVTQWFQLGCHPFDRESKVFQSLRTVRIMHQRVASMMNAKILSDSDNRYDTKKLWINQRDMCHTQFAFVGLMAVFPKELGYHTFTAADFHALFHFWRVIGHCLGIEDRFNLCTSEDDRQTSELCRRIYYDDWQGRIRDNPHTMTTSKAMSEGIAIALRQLNPWLDLPALMHYSAPFLGLDPSNYKLDSIRSTIIYTVYWSFFRYSSQLKPIHSLASVINRRAMNRGAEDSNSHRQYLEEKYPQAIHAKIDLTKLSCFQRNQPSN